jgi:response regulator RpfG family c-di-GMP phosphodiesterase
MSGRQGVTVEKILLVDDDQNILSGYRRSLRNDFRVETAEGGEAGLEALRSNGPFAVVVSDLRMPGMDGNQFLREVRSNFPETVRMMLTGQADLQSASEAVNEGNIFRFLFKPCPQEVLTKALGEGIRQYQLIKAERDLLENTLSGTVQLLVDILALVNPSAFGRASRLQQIMRVLLPHFGRENAWKLDVSAMLSQIGLVSLPAEVVDKICAGTATSPEETAMLENHPLCGRDLLAKIPRLEEISLNVAYQAKRFDGAGPPYEGMRGRQIPLGGRILKIALDYDSLIQSGSTPEAAFAELNNRNGWYDPELLGVLEQAVLNVRTGYTFHLVAAAQLRPGMLLPDGAKTANGNLVVGKGAEVTLAMLTKLQNFARFQGLTEPIRALVPRGQRVGPAPEAAAIEQDSTSAR